MADKTTKTTVRNTSPGVRGLNTVQGYRDLNPGETAENVELTAAELKNAKATGYFAFGSSADAEPEAPEQPKEPPVPNPTDQATGGPKSEPAPGGTTDELDTMDDETLRNTAAALSGKSVADLADTDREGLLKLARGE